MTTKSNVIQLRAREAYKSLLRLAATRVSRLPVVHAPLGSLSGTVTLLVTGNDGEGWAKRTLAPKQALELARNLRRVAAEAQRNLKANR